MKVYLNGISNPYPMIVLRGKLKLCGFDSLKAEKIIQGIINDSKSWKHLKTEDELFSICRDSVTSHDSKIRNNITTIMEYDNLRRNTSLPPIIIIIEGASATGKSMLTLAMTYNLSITRVLGTDTFRQVQRSIYSKEKHPEIHCHTYQAYNYRQAGSENLHPIVRGYLAQCEYIEPMTRRFTTRIINEGTEAIIEGVHVVPGTLADIGENIIEVLVNVELETHKSMFQSKHTAAKLKSVTDDESIRIKEFEATRLIQDYMIDTAHSSGTPIVEITTFEDAENSICEMVLDRMIALIASM